MPRRRIQRRNWRTAQPPSTARLLECRLPGLGQHRRRTVLYFTTAYLVLAPAIPLFECIYTARVHVARGVWRVGDRGEANWPEKSKGVFCIRHIRTRETAETYTYLVCTENQQPLYTVKNKRGETLFCPRPVMAWFRSYGEVVSVNHVHQRQPHTQGKRSKEAGQHGRSLLIFVFGAKFARFPF